MSQKFTILLTTMLLFALMSRGQNPDCKDYHNGTFKLIDSVNNREYLIQRGNDMQVEINLHTGDTTKFRVDWADECKYYLTIIDGKEDIMDFYKGKKLIIEIAEVYEDGYKFSAQMEGYKPKIFQTVRKVE